MVSRHRYMDPLGFFGEGNVFAGFDDGLVEAFLARAEYLSDSDQEGDPYGVGLGESVRRWRGAYAGNVAIQTGALNETPTFSDDGELAFDGDDALDVAWLAPTLQGTHSIIIRWYAQNSSIQRTMLGAGRSTTSTPFYQVGHQGNENRAAIRVRNNSGSVSTLQSTSAVNDNSEIYREDVYRLSSTESWTLQTLDSVEATIANPGAMTFDQAEIGVMPLGGSRSQFGFGRLEALLIFNTIITEAQEAAARTYLDSL